MRIQVRPRGASSVKVRFQPYVGLETASQADAEGGTVDNKAMTPLRTAQAIVAQGDARYYTQAQADAALNTALGDYVPITRKVAGHALSSDVTLAKGDVGLGNVDNTSDAEKPISTATQTALDAKAWNKIDSQDITNQGQVGITLPSGYKAFKLIIRKLKVGTDGQPCYVRFAAGGTVFQSSSNYNWGQVFQSQAAGPSAYTAAGASVSNAMVFSPGNLPAATSGQLAECMIEPGSATQFPCLLWHFHFVASTGQVQTVGSGYYGGSVRADVIWFFPPSGVFANFAYELEGLL